MPLGLKVVKPYPIWTDPVQHGTTTSTKKKKKKTSTEGIFFPFSNGILRLFLGGPRWLLLGPWASYVSLGSYCFPFRARSWNPAGPAPCVPASPPHHSCAGNCRCSPIQLSPGNVRLWGQELFWTAPVRLGVGQGECSWHEEATGTFSVWNFSWCFLGSLELFISLSFLSMGRQGCLEGSLLVDFQSMSFSRTKSCVPSAPFAKFRMLPAGWWISWYGLLEALLPILHRWSDL